MRRKVSMKVRQGVGGVGGNEAGGEEGRKVSKVRQVHPRDSHSLSGERPDESNSASKSGGAGRWVGGGVGR